MKLELNTDPAVTPSMRPTNDKFRRRRLLDRTPSLQSFLSSQSDQFVPFY